MSSYTSPLYYNQALIVLDTTAVTGQTQGSVVLYGGLNVNNTVDSTNQSTGSVVLYGGLGIQGTVNGVNANFSDNVTVNASTVSSDTLSGALIVKGGVGIGGDINKAMLFVCNNPQCPTRVTCTTKGISI